MEDKILIAVIAALAALFGSLIPSALTYFNNNKQREFEAKKVLLEKQSTVYKDLILTLQEFANHPEKADRNFYKFQGAVLQTVIYGDKAAAEAANMYYQELVNSSAGRRPSLTKEEHDKYHAKILNSIRYSLGLVSIANFSMTRFTPQ